MKNSHGQRKNKDSQKLIKGKMCEKKRDFKKQPKRRKKVILIENERRKRTSSSRSEATQRRGGATQSRLSRVGPFLR